MKSFRLTNLDDSESNQEVWSVCIEYKLFIEELLIEFFDNPIDHFQRCFSENPLGALERCCFDTAKPYDLQDSIYIFKDMGKKYGTKKKWVKELKLQLEKFIANSAS